MRQRSDVLIVSLISVVMMIYLIANPPGGQAEDAHHPPPVAAATDQSRPPVVPMPPVAASETKTADTTAPWVTRGEKVPPRVLYSLDHPAPLYEAKPQTWHNKLLFPTVRCPYCGRRAPTKKTTYIWLLVGMIGQIIFSLRFIVQIIASEKAKRSVIPVSFWWLSIGGSILLLGYAISIPVWPIILGQIPGCLIYARNLWLVKNDKTKNATE